MDKDQLTQEYKEYSAYYQALQVEVFNFVNNIKEQKQNIIDIANINQRPKDEIKSLTSLQKNLEDGKYKTHKSLLDIKDVAGVRVTCHCEDDVNNLATLLVGELLQAGYFTVERKDTGGKVVEYPYRATHVTFAKKIKIEEKDYLLNCEIQIRTVMADAWAVQNHKYVYKKIGKGEPHDLTDAVSTIMSGCEKLWSLVKRKSLNMQEKDLESSIAEIHDKTEMQLARVQTPATQTSSMDGWFKENKTKALEGIKKIGFKTYMEVQIISPQIEKKIAKKELLDKADSATIKYFGWPIGVVLRNRQEYAPRPNTTGIYAEISIADAKTDNSVKRESYDYWSLHENGSFYLMQSLFEDQRKPGYVFFNTRIVRITEVLMYVYNLYSSIDVPQDTPIEITIKHSGLKGRKLNSATWNRELFQDYTTETDEVSNTVTASLKEIKDSPVSVVEKFTQPLFEQFEFFELSRRVLDDIVSNYLKGKVV